MWRTASKRCLPPWAHRRQVQISCLVKHNIAAGRSLTSNKVSFATHVPSPQFLASPIAVACLVLATTLTTTRTKLGVVECSAGGGGDGEGTTTQRLQRFIQEKKTSLKSTKYTNDNQLPEYTLAEVAEHNGKDSSSPSIWMSYGGIVYDVTDFVPLHPGGTSRIQRAGGMAIEPHWWFHQQHFKNELPQQVLDTLVVGRLCESDQEQVNQELEQLQQQLEGSCLTLEIQQNSKETNISKTFSLDQLQQLPRTESSNTVGCPTTQQQHRPTSVFAGVRLQHLLESATSSASRSRNSDNNNNNNSSMNSNGVVVFHALDGETLQVELEEDILICYEMDGAPLTQARGFPLRILFPGKRRVIKWVQKIQVKVNE